MATSLKLDSETRDRVYNKFSSLSHIKAYNEISKYTGLEKDEKVKRWPEIWYAICFMQSGHRTKLLPLFEAQPAWKKADSEMYKRVAELQINRAKYDHRIKPFRAHETDWKCPYPGCEQEIKNWEDVYPSCSHPEITGKERHCGFHSSCLLKVADELKAAEESNRKAGKTRSKKEENHYKTPQQQKSTKNVLELPPSLNRKRRRRDWDFGSESDTGDSDTGESDTEESDTEESDTGKRKNKRARNKLTPPSEDEGGDDSKFDARKFPGLPKWGGRKEKEGKEGKEGKKVKKGKK